MARPAPPIPVAALTGPVRLADAARLGVPRHELLAPRWQRVAAHAADSLREEELERLGLLVVRVTALDLCPGRRPLVQRPRRLGRSRHPAPLVPLRRSSRES